MPSGPPVDWTETRRRNIEALEELSEAVADKIQSDRLILFRTSPGQLRALVAGGDGFDFRVEPGWLENPEDLEEAVSCCDENAWWLPFLIRLRDDNRVIGVCLHKGPPDERAMVEIAYAIAPTYRCQGYAREAIAALSNSTLLLPEVNIIRAHTQPERNASSRVLAHCGFTRTGIIEDPNEGMLWRWEMGNPHSP